MSEPGVRLLTDAREFAPDLVARDEALLVSQAQGLSSRVFPLALAHWRRLADPDGAQADAGRAFERRRLHVSATWAGMVRLDGDLHPESGVVVITALGSLADPGALDPDDRRTPQQRRADALVEICRRHLDTADRPLVGGERPHLLVGVDLATLQGRGERLVDPDTGPITAEAARRLGCDVAVTRIVFRGGSEPLEVGRAARVVPAAVRRALGVRDRGCTYPGCDLPARWCDAHHQVHWADGGATDLGKPAPFWRGKVGMRLAPPWQPGAFQPCRGSMVQLLRAQGAELLLAALQGLTVWKMLDPGFDFATHARDLLASAVGQG